MKTRTMFMHTLDSRPAFYQGDQIVFANQGRYSRRGLTLVPTIEQIRREQKASEAWRKSQGWFDRNDYGYVRVEVPR